MLITRLQVGFSGGQIGAGVATHYAIPGNQLQPAFAAFWSYISNTAQTSATFVNVPNFGDTINVESGKLEAVWSFGTALNRSGAGPGAHAAGVGACVTWITGGIVNGHRVKGRTFLVPLALTAYDTDGTINDTVLSDLRSACTVLLGATGDAFGIYSRPVADGPGVEGRDGTFHPVTGFRIADRVSTLRTRR